MGLGLQSRLLLGLGLAALLVSACNETQNNNTTIGPLQPPPVPKAGTASASGCTGKLAGSDPLLPYQWYIRNTGSGAALAFSSGTAAAGQDINLGAVTLTGCGVKVAVVDQGLEIRHEDLRDNVVPGGSVDYSSTPLTTDPTNSSPYGDHGTSVAGIIAMRGGNGIGGRGVAGEASLVGYNLLGNNGNNVSLANMLGALGGASYAADVAVFNESWGYDTAVPFPVDATLEGQYGYGVNTLRGGLGAIYVKAAGNGFRGFTDSSTGSAANCSASKAAGLTCQNVSMDPYNTLPTQLMLGAVTATGTRSSYSSAGSALWVSAPGGEFGLDQAMGWAPPPTNPAYFFGPAMVTTDQSGCNQGMSVEFVSSPPYRYANTFDNGVSSALNPNCNYTSTMNGTSSAAPVTSGVVALLLQANPNLTWRDVKHVLAKTASNDLTVPTFVTATTTVALSDGGYIAEPPWTANAAPAANGGPYRFHNWYGFGRVNVSAAVALATGYSSGWPALTDTGFLTGAVATSILADNSVNGATGSVTLSGKPGFIEAVQVKLNLTHPKLGDVGVELTSPGGTRSVLLNVLNGYAASGTVDLLLAGNAFYGEPANGAWTLKVVDGASGPSGTQTLNSWAVRIYGH
jgi:subtilisin family serine protease